MGNINDLATWWCRFVGYPGGCGGLSLSEVALVFGLALVGGIFSVVALFNLAKVLKL